MAVPAPESVLARDREHGRARDEAVAARVLALQRSAGNAAVAAVLRRPARALLQRQLPDSSQEWAEQLKTIEVRDAVAWCGLLSKLDPTRKYTADKGLVVINGVMGLHPRKLVELYEDRLLTRVLARIPAGVASVSELRSNPELKLLSMTYGLRFMVEDAAFQGPFGPGHITSTDQPDNKTRAAEYAEWLVRKGYIATKTNAQLANHAQFYLSTAKHDAVPKQEWASKRDVAFDEVWAVYTKLASSGVKSLPGATGKHLQVPLAGKPTEIVELLRKHADALFFQSDSAALYHAAKHYRDVVRPGGQASTTALKTVKPQAVDVDVGAYVDAARRIVANAPPPRVEALQGSEGYKFEFELDGVLAIVRARPSELGFGEAVIASAHSHGGTGPTGPTRGDAVGLQPILPSEPGAAARLTTLLASMAKQGHFGALQPPNSEVHYVGSPAPGLVFVVENGTGARSVYYVKVALGDPATDVLEAPDAKDAIMAERFITSLKEGANYVWQRSMTIRLTRVQADATVPLAKPVDLTRDINKDNVAEALAPVAVHVGKRSAPTAAEQLAALVDARRFGEKAAKDAKLGLPTGGTAKPLQDQEVAKIRQALQWRQSFTQQFDALVRRDPKVGADLLDAFSKLDQSALEDEERAAYDEVVHQIQAFGLHKAYAEQKKGTTAVTPELVAHILFPGSGASGISGGHLDKNLLDWVAAHPAYHLVKTHEVTFDKITLRAYDQYFWDPALNRDVPPPDVSDAAKRPRPGHDMAATWTKGAIPKTTASDLTFYLSQGELAFARHLSENPDFVKTKAKSFGATEKGAQKAAAPAEAEIGFSGHVQWVADSPFIKSLYLSLDWLHAHSGKTISSSQQLIVI